MSTSLTPIQHLYNGVLILQRGDGYWNATAMCQANDKRWNNYWQTVSTQEFLAELASVTGIPVTELVQVRQGGSPILQGTWVHRRVALDLARWCSPAFAVRVNGWVEELLTKGRVELQASQPVPVAQPADSLETVCRFLAACERVFTLGGAEIEPRDQLLMRDFARTRLGLAAEEATGVARFVTLPERCVQLGYPRPRRGEDSQVGKAVAAAYRRAHDQDPPQHRQFIDGRVVSVNCYTVDDLPVVDEGIRAYHQAHNRLRSPEN